MIPIWDYGDPNAIKASLRDTLARTPKDRWAWSVAVIRPEEIEVLSRVEFARFLRANALAKLAEKVEATAVPPGRILTWLESDASGVSLRIVDPTRLLQPMGPFVYKPPEPGAQDPRSLWPTSTRLGLRHR